jgi:hypothetical protein
MKYWVVGAGRVGLRKRVLRGSRPPRATADSLFYTNT